MYWTICVSSIQLICNPIRSLKNDVKEILFGDEARVGVGKLATLTGPYRICYADVTRN